MATTPKHVAFVGVTRVLIHNNARN